VIRAALVVALLIAGAALVVGGIWMFSPACAVIAAGVLLILTVIDIRSLS
jgi:hypothetical protein